MGVRLHHGFLHQVLSVRVIMAHAKRVAVEQIAQRNDLTFEPCTQLGVDRPALDRFAGLFHPRVGLRRGHCHPSEVESRDLAGGRATQNCCVIVVPNRSDTESTASRTVFASLRI